MARINTIHNKVKRILENKPETRSDDWLLILEVWKEYISPVMSVEHLLTHHIELGVPSFESIRRTRQKIQADNPHLVEELAVAFRMAKEAEYRQYARGNQGKVVDPGCDYCVCCGSVVPEGRMVCPNCEPKPEKVGKVMKWKKFKRSEEVSNEI